MLITKRRVNEEILIGEGIRIVVVKTGKNKVSIGVEAPKEVPLSIPTRSTENDSPPRAYNLCGKT